jgi:aminoglycoside phosphotransferase family enzyme/predicted kinase
MSKTLIDNLQNPTLFEHSVTEFKTYETHSSIVLTTGDYVYKIKKPVNFGFLDYSSLEKRLYHCQREVTLNRSLANDVYIDVIGIYGDATHPSFTAKGEPFEYAVKMRQFPQENILSTLLTKNKITPELINQLAARIAEFHQQIPVAEKSVFYGNAEHIQQFAKNNFIETLPFLTNKDDIAELKQLEQLTHNTYENIKPTLQQRKDNGYIRHCHGDMHLNNIVVINNEPVIFDCIEFNEDFIWTDVMGDLGFIIMDLDEHNKPELANLLLNRYLEITGDYTALTVLPYFCAYRAMVRAKVDQIRLSQPGLTSAEQQQIQMHYRACLELVKGYLSQQQPRLAIMHGFCSSGKSTIAQQLVATQGMIQLRSDAERKRLANLALTANSNSALYAGIYTPKNTDKVYAHLAQLATEIIHAGYSVVIDAAFIRHDLRQQFIKLAEQLNVPYKIIACTAPEQQLRDWITKRSNNPSEISEGRLEILEHQLQHHDPLTKEESLHTIIINTTNAITAKDLEF